MQPNTAAYCPLLNWPRSRLKLKPRVIGIMIIDSSEKASNLTYLLVQFYSHLLSSAGWPSLYISSVSPVWRPSGVASPRSITRPSRRVRRFIMPPILPASWYESEKIPRKWKKSLCVRSLKIDAKAFCLNFDRFGGSSSRSFGNCLLGSAESRGSAVIFRPYIAYLVTSPR